MEFGDKRFKYPPLKDAKLISSPLTMNDSLDYLSVVALIVEIANKMFQDEEKHMFFKDIEESVAALKEHKDKLMVSIILLARAIKIAGAELEVDQCVFCGTRKDIVAFSFPDGGFLCRNCLSENANLDLTPSQMKLIRYAFKSPNYSCNGAEVYSKNDKELILKHLQGYIYDDLGVDLNAIKQILN